MRAIDISNYTDPLTPDAVAAWRRDGVGLVIVQAINPPPGYPAGQTRQQVQVVTDAGLPYDAYLFLFNVDTHSARAQMQSKLALLDGLPNPREVWIDAEDTGGATVENRVACLLTACEEADAWCTAHGLPPAGIYSASWFWLGYMGNSWLFKDRELWVAEYDGKQDPQTFTWFGGWSSARIKQYAGTSTLDGIGNVDLNVLSAEEETEMDIPTPVSGGLSTTTNVERETPGDYPFPDWRQSAIAYRGALDAMGRQLADEKAHAADLSAQLTRYQRAGKDDWAQPA